MVGQSRGHSRGALLLVVLFVLAAGCLAVASPVAAGDLDEDDINIAVEPTETDVEPGDTTTYEVVVEGPEKGIIGYDHFDIVVENPDVAQFVDFYETAEENAEGDEVASSTEIQDLDGNETDAGPVLAMSAALSIGGYEFDGADEHVIAEIEVEVLGDVPSATDLAIVENPEEGIYDEPPIWYDVDEDAYDVNAFEHGELVVPAEAGVSLEPAETELLPGETTTYEVVVEGATHGIQAYEGIEVVIEDGDTGAFVDFEEAAFAGTADSGEAVSHSEIRDGAGNAVDAGPVLWLEADLGDSAFDGAEEVVIAEVEAEVTGIQPSAVTVSENPGLQDLDGIAYDVTAAGESELDPIGIDVTGDGEPATDTTGDGLLNDVDGDGEFAIFDVQALFNNFQDDIVQDNPGLFNFDESEPPEVTIFDVQALFNDLVES